MSRATERQVKQLQRLVPFQPSHAVPAPRVRLQPALPFHADPAHTIPTKWALYRPLLRALRGGAALRSAVPASTLKVVRAHPAAVQTAANRTPPREWETPVPHRLNRRTKGTKYAPPKRDVLEFFPSDAHAPPPPPSTPEAAHPRLLDHLRARWRKGRTMLSLPAAREFLSTEMVTLAALRAPDSYRELLKSLEAGAERFAETHASFVRAEQNAIAEDDARVAADAARPPFVTASLMPRSMYWVPMPRLKPQPARLSMMIRQRALRRTRRLIKERRADSEMEDIRHEVHFWRLLGVDNRSKIGAWASGQNAGSWLAEYRRYKDLLSEQYDRENKRFAMRYSDKQLDAVRAARRRRHALRVNKARAERGLGPLFNDDGSKVEGATSSAYEVDRERKEAAEAAARERKEETGGKEA